MERQRSIKTWAVCLSFLALIVFKPTGVGAESEHSSAHSKEGHAKGGHFDEGHSTEGAVTVDGIKVVFMFSQSMSMIDIVLTDVKTGRPVTGAKVNGTVTNPDGKIQTKELIGMKMGKEYSFGNTVDISQKGVYKLDVTADISGKKVKFPFKFEVRS
ncbi:MAG: hypothetical protein HZB81_07490 [Deltaproteobacteria bacterium]|nr:hypothetical protein [Deltaproteobacteria bacterium]